MFIFVTRFKREMNSNWERGITISKDSEGMTKETILIDKNLSVVTQLPWDITNLYTGGYVEFNLED